MKGKKIIVGVSGGIAAYKTCELVRLFKKSGAEVRVVMTPSALNFVSPLTLSALSGNEVLVNIFPENTEGHVEKIEVKTWHVYSGIWADVMVVAPATANTIAKLVHGESDNFLLATVLASRCPVVVAPSMDEDMYINPVTTSNISKLKEFGFMVMEPETGELASGLYGKGRMPEPQTIFDITSGVLKGTHKDFEGKRLMITAGPTYEPIDDVRFIGNYSSGKMGFAIANAAALRGAEVTLVTGPTMLTSPRHVNRINVNTASEMFVSVKEHLNGQDFVIMSAAVSDYRPNNPKQGKLKKSAGDMTLKLERTEDILEYAGKNKTNFKLAGFALETENEIEYAKEKIRKKNLDLIVVNNPKTEGAGFGTDTNVASIIDKDFNVINLDRMSKFDLANSILDKLKEV